MRTASVTVTSISTPVSTFGRGAFAVAREAIAALDRWQARRNALRQLYMVDRRTLRDIGIDRSELISIVHGDRFGRRRPHGAD
jgi:uncharacterized protein YjiS (DUF1127 family)